MAHATYLREKARSMRIERQFTIDELAERLALSRSTIYYWVRDLPIPGCVRIEVGWTSTVLPQNSHQVEQQPDDGPHVALAPRRSHGAHVRHKLPGASAGVDGSSAIRVAIGLDSHGVGVDTEATSG